MSKRASPRYDAQFDLFVPYLTDLPLRDQRDTMERPFFSLSKNKRLKAINYESPDGAVWVKVEAMPAYGMATIYDADILIWAASQIAEQIDRRGRNDVPGPTLSFHPYNLLRAIRREVGGDQYRRLKEALDRLKTTAIKTNLRAEGRKREARFSWLDSWTDTVDEATGDSRGMTLTLSKWLYDGIVKEGGVLAIHPDYFLLTGALERWLYRVARKHAGMQPQGWTCSVSTLYEKSGSESPLRRFRFEVKKLAEADELPEYHLEWVDKTESEEPSLHAVRRSLLDPSHPAFQFPQTKDKRRPVGPRS